VKGPAEALRACDCTALDTCSQFLEVGLTPFEEIMVVD
jgi:hypothetical protein